MQQTDVRTTTYPFATLLILDGWGEAPASQTNAIKMAHTPNMDYLYAHGVSTLLQASGESVGLPHGIIGNSEVGHLNIGAGKVVLQEVLKINKAIETGEFFKNPVFLEGIAHAKEHQAAIHIVGLCSNALVHASIDHLFALLKTCAENDFTQKIYIHVITDGRDTAVDASYQYINQIEGYIKEHGIGQIATVSGRYYAMDRDERWDRTQKSYDAMIAKDNTTPYFSSALDGIRANMNNQKTDEFIVPFRITPDSVDKLERLVHPQDTIIFFNFREDRPRQLTRAFVDALCTEFPHTYIPVHFITMTEYEKGLCKNIAYQKDLVNEPLSKVIADKGFTEFKIAETEKYAHVTYFFNGGREVAFPLEDRFLIPSLKIATYDLMPQMRVREITAELTKRIDTERYKLLVANFANADMVGHTGNLAATIAACQYVDDCVGKVMQHTFDHGGILFVTADHGNAEIKFDTKIQEVSTRHTTSPVPFIIASKDTHTKEHMSEGKLSDVAPTILNRLGLDKGFDMDGTNLLV